MKNGYYVPEAQELGQFVIDVLTDLGAIEKKLKKALSRLESLEDENERLNKKIGSMQTQLNVNRRVGWRR